VNIESNNNGSSGVYIQGDGDNTIVSPKVKGNGLYGFLIQGHGTNKLTDVDIKDNTYHGIFSFGGIAEVHGGVIEKNGYSVFPSSSNVNEHFREWDWTGDWCIDEDWDGMKDGEGVFVAQGPEGWLTLKKC
jgi:hypothetical protein